MAKRECLQCKREVFGRSDKKFCSDYCRSIFNNEANSQDNSYIKTINKILRKNRKILKALNPNGKAKVHQQKLLEQGFRLNYFTNQYITKKGLVYNFCYEYGFLKLENDYYAIVTKKDYVE